MNPVILITGGSGFIGRYVVRELVKRDVSVRLLTRNQLSANAFESSERVVVELGDVSDLDSLCRVAAGCSSVIHLVGIIEERRKEGVTFESVHEKGTENVLTAAREAGVDVFVHMSANGARADGVSRYQTTKWAAEEMVRASGFKQWSIFRPSLVFGKPEAGQPEFCTQMVRSLIRALPVWPVFGSGNYEFRPVFVQDLATALALAAISPPAVNRSYCAGGPDTLRYVELLDVLSRAIGKKPRPKIFQPVWLSRSLVNMLSPTGLLPISPDQFEMLLEGNTCDPSDYQEEFGVVPTPFAAEALSYLKEG